jgi:hypothetical protein
MPVVVGPVVVTGLVYISILRTFLLETPYGSPTIHARWVTRKVPDWAEGLRLTTHSFQPETVALEFSLCFFCLVTGFSTMLFSVGKGRTCGIFVGLER